jgi:hypothetical protein
MTRKVNDTEKRRAGIMDGRGRMQKNEPSMCAVVGMVWSAQI